MSCTATTCRRWISRSSATSFPQTWEFKKLQVAGLVEEARLLDFSRRRTANMVLNDGFGGDQRAFLHFVEQVRILQQVANDLLAAILPVKPELVNLLMRCSETRMENLHYDLDADADGHEAFRLYINLDRAPRIWATSYQMSDLLARGGQRLVAGLTKDLPGETILKRAATRAYGGWNQRATERVSPRHMIYVDPGDIFFVDGRCVSHQVLTGHRVFTVYAKIPHGNAVHPTFGEKIRSALAQAQQVPIGKETALVNYYEPAQVTASPHVREEWSSVFGTTRTGRVRSFDDVGMRGESAGS
ncbi:MAG: hypothetical protein IPK26_21235 [Planctomycetes bacterium]|nr:hypothetical protein [Planctomycetota bacterium]